MKITKKQIKAAEKRMGMELLNPIGSCFRSSLRQMIFVEEDRPADIRLHRGIIECNMVGQEGEISGHAWLEYTNETGEKVAYDSTWGTTHMANRYRKRLKLSYEVSYSLEEAKEAALINLTPGPWDSKIISIYK